MDLPRGDDEYLAFLLVANWSLHTGRRLREAPPEELTEGELMEFWSDPTWETAPTLGHSP
ncbi:hypothetical protein GCM10010191_02240 [Actinomadura vinacea]|uniref:Uncharacterized protein n=1 Tax=Actinomadura vinacea TaxID=115336 RepID=A0ABN3IBD9_9ACTN